MNQFGGDDYSSTEYSSVCNFSQYDVGDCTIFVLEFRLAYYRYKFSYCKYYIAPFCLFKDEEEQTGSGAENEESGSYLPPPRTY